MGQMIVKVKLKEYLSQKNIRMGEDFPNALEEKLKEMIDKAVERAKANKRNTVMARDI